MRIDATPQRLNAIPGTPALITIHVVNTGTIISGHEVRILGVDPQWVSIDQPQLSLFPEASGTIIVAVTLPEGVPAGTRRISIEVAELTPPMDVEVVPIELTVPAELGLSLQLDPMSVTGGGTVSSGILIENTGNSKVDVVLNGTDDEGAIDFAFTPPTPMLEPGERLLGSVELKARRPWFGSPKVRPFTIMAGPTSSPVLALGAWVQKPRISRGALALAGLVMAVTVFATVLTATLSSVVNTSVANRDLALQVAANAQGAGNTGTSSITGTVTLLSSGLPASAVTVSLFTASNTSSAIFSTATGPTGSYSFNNIAGGSYKVQFGGAGFVPTWYPEALAPQNGETVVTKADKTTSSINGIVSGNPASIAGQVIGANTAGATLSVQLISQGISSTGSPINAVVTTQELNANGQFTLGPLPAPNTYVLVVSLPDYANATQTVTVAEGEARTGVVMTLSRGNGSIAGTVTSNGKPVGQASIDATNGTSVASAVSAADGSFRLSSLPAPSVLTLSITAPGFATQTMSLSLTSEQHHLKGVAIQLAPGSGQISGAVNTAPGVPVGGVAITASNGSSTFSTLSASGSGNWVISNLPVPGTYNITYTRSDLVTQSSVATLSAGSPQQQVPTIAMIQNLASVSGVITQQGSAIGGVAIDFTSGASNYKATSATTTSGSSGTMTGAYAITQMAPGTYTVSFTIIGGVPVTSVVTLVAGQNTVLNENLGPSASITGTVTDSSTLGAPGVGGVSVTLYLTSQFPIVVTATTTTNARGIYSFRNVVAPQDYVVTFAYPSSSPAQSSTNCTSSLGAGVTCNGQVATR